jgi:hypothetical protein
MSSSSNVATKSSVDVRTPTLRFSPMVQRRPSSGRFTTTMSATIDSNGSPSFTMISRLFG